MQGADLGWGGKVRCRSDSEELWRALLALQKAFNFTGEEKETVYKQRPYSIKLALKIGCLIETGTFKNNFWNNFKFGENIWAQKSPPPDPYCEPQQHVLSSSDPISHWASLSIHTHKHTHTHTHTHLCLVTQLCPTLCDPMDCSPPGSFVQGDSPGKNTGVGCHALLRGILQTQGSNPGLPHCRCILYRLSHKGSPRVLEWTAYPLSRATSRPRNQTKVSCIVGGFFTSWATSWAYLSSLVFFWVIWQRVSDMTSHHPEILHCLFPQNKDSLCSAALSLKK